MQKLSMEELNRKSVEQVKQADKMPVIAVLENVRSAYNVGSVFRTADAFLIEGVYLCGYTAHPPHKEIKKTALGAEDSVLWKHFKQIGDAIQDLKDQGFHIYAVEQVKDSQFLNKLDLPKGKIAVVFGNEVTGVEQTTIGLCDGCIEIPQLGMKHSLNISVSAGIVLWELIRNKIDSVAKST